MGMAEAGLCPGSLLQILISYQKYIFFKKLKKLLTVRIIRAIMNER